MWTSLNVKVRMPPIHRLITAFGLKVGMVEHLLDIFGIDFNDEVLDSNDVKSKMS